MKNIPLAEVLKTVVLSPNVVSRLPITEKYDKNVQGNTLVERGQAAVSVILPFMDFPELPADKKNIGVCVGTGGNPYAARISAGQAAEMAIAESALKVACVGGDWLGATDCLNFGNPEKSSQMGEFVAAVEGLKVACSTLDIPIVSGNVSLYNESNNQSIPPSALVSVFGRVADQRTIKALTWSEDAFIYRLGKADQALGSSEFNNLFNLESTELPACDYDQIKTLAAQVRQLAGQPEVQAIIPFSAGGLWGTLVGAALRSEIGFKLNPGALATLADLFAEPLNLLVVSSSPLPGLTEIGRTQSVLQAQFSLAGDDHIFDLATLKDEWHNQLRSVF